MNTKSLFRLFAIAIIFSIAFTSCKKDETTASSSTNGSFTCKIDGVQFTATTLANTLIGDVTGKRLDVRGTDASGKQLIYTINDVDPMGTNFSHLRDTVYVDASKNTPIGIVTLGTLVKTDGSFIMSVGEGKEAGYSILTSCDLSTGRASGVFEFLLIDFATDDTTFVTEGKFTNVKF